MKFIIHNCFKFYIHLFLPITMSIYMLDWHIILNIITWIPITLPRFNYFNFCRTKKILIVLSVVLANNSFDFNLGCWCCRTIPLSFPSYLLVEFCRIISFLNSSLYDDFFIWSCILFEFYWSLLGFFLLNSINFLSFCSFIGCLYLLIFNDFLLREFLQFLCFNFSKSSLVKNLIAL